MSALDELEDFLRTKIEKERWTHPKLSAYLQGLYPGRRGFGVRSLENFCRAKNIHKTSRLNTSEIDTVVSGAVAKVRYIRFPLTLN